MEIATFYMVAKRNASIILGVRLVRGLIVARNMAKEATFNRVTLDNEHF